VTKLATGRQAVAGASEALEAIGGLGYIESTGLPELLRDAQVLPIWEGTTNVLALEAIRAIHRTNALEPFLLEVRTLASSARHSSLLEPSRTALSAADRAEEWWRAAQGRGAFTLEAHARRFALTLARTLALALLVDQAQWAIDEEHDGRTAEAARRFADRGVDLLLSTDSQQEATRALALDEPLTR
jgi:alkylation response protein AidB-like acyl-CoA dehydrogenase